MDYEKAKADFEKAKADFEKAKADKAKADFEKAKTDAGQFLGGLVVLAVFGAFVYGVYWLFSGPSEPANDALRAQRAAATQAVAERTSVAPGIAQSAERDGPSTSLVIGNCRGYIRVALDLDVDFPGGLFASGESAKVTIVRSGDGQYSSYVQRDGQRRFFVCEANEERVTDFAWLAPWFTP